MVLKKNLPAIISFSSFSRFLRFPLNRPLLQAKSPLNDETIGYSKRNKMHKSLLRCPKGTIFYDKKQMLIRRSLINKIIEIIKLFGAVEIETPLLELKEYMTEKGNLNPTDFYSCKDQGGEMVSIRYDLTYPLARYVAQHLVGKMRCYQIGRVCRREPISLNKSSLRDFYQLDFNIVGPWEPMVSDAECIQLLHKVLTELNLSKFILKVSHRKILDGIFAHCGFPLEKYPHIHSFIKKWDKMSWEKLQKVMIEENGLDRVMIDKLSQFVNLYGGRELIYKLQKDQSLLNSEDFQEGLKELLLIFDYCQHLGCDANLVFDVGLSRGFNYYTGVVFEALLVEEDADFSLATVAGGGRYDKLISQFAPRNRRDVACVGVSFGIDDLFAFHQKKRNIEVKTGADELRWTVRPSTFKELPKTDSEITKASNLVLKTPKGTRDFGPSEAAHRRTVLEAIVDVFHLHGAEEIYSPAFEFTEILNGNYGDDSKLIYELEEGPENEALSLKYDLTVSLARFLALNKISNIKSFQIDTVHRRDSPAEIRGRFREFCQCDLDIAGHYDTMVPDAECIQVIQQVLTKLDLGRFIIKVNHRKILNGIFARCGVPAEMFGPVCSAVDKLDKMSWEDVRKEMLEEKGLDASVADRIGEYARLRGGEELIYELQKDQSLVDSLNAQEGLNELLLLSEYCKLLDCHTNVVYDLSLARGLDYYTGVIFEAVLADADNAVVGSIAAGGRYDNLVKKFDPDGRSIPCVGVSFGVERLFALYQKRKITKADKILNTECQILVVCPNKGLMPEVVSLLNLLRGANISAETCYKNKGKLLNQLQYAEDKCIPLLLLVGESEIENGVVKLRSTESREEVTVSRKDVLKSIKERLNQHLIIDK